MATFLLIHGAWSGGWCWERTVPPLAARGHAVAAPDLPGHGDDPADRVGITMDDYAARVVERLRALPEPAILVGHSMGGMVVSAAAALLPERVRALVYLCAYLPRDGESLVLVEARNPRPTVALAMEAEAAGALLTVPPERRRALFFGDADEAAAREAEARMTPQPALPFGAPVRLGEGFARLPKHYVLCARDGAIAPELQRDMAAATPGVTLHRLDADHSPFLSQPAALAGLLDRIAAHA